MKWLESLCRELDVEINEEWLGTDSEFYMLKRDGRLLVKNQKMNTWSMASGLAYMRVLNGDLAEQWYPEIGKPVYLPAPVEKDRYIKKIWENSKLDRENSDKGLVFKTKEKAIEMANKMLKAARGENK